MNIKFWQKHQNTELEEAKEMLITSHKDVLNIIQTFSDEELFIKQLFAWTNTTNLTSYCISSTSSHYNWAIKKLRMHIKQTSK